jgi:hypothetical protein
MNKKIEVDLNEVKRVYKLMEEINDFFHQPMNFKNVEKFAKEKYKEINSVYYDVIWGWLPKDIQNEITNS